MKSVPLSKAVIPFLLLLDSFSLLANAKITPLSWKEAYSKAEKLVDQMSVEQMVKITTGQGWSKGLCVGQTYAIESPDFPSLCLQDGPLGVRLADNITAGVAGINAAASFDKNAIYERGRYMGQEFRGKGAHIQLGPVMNLMRSPEGGRGWEASGEDPFLSGVVAAETIKGIQEEGVIATAKHYILNDQELNRTTSSSDIDDRSFHEVYLWPFARAVEAGVGSIMCSYNIINGTHACEDDHTLNTVLKGELGFKGFVQSDWGATHSTVNAANHGLDMDMPGTIGFDFKANASYFGKNLTNAVHDKKVKKERLSNMVTRIVAAWYKMRQDSGFPETTIGTGVQVNVQANHRKLVRSMGAASSVLLKNSGILPVDPQKVSKIAIIGSDAAPNPVYLDSSRTCSNDTCTVGTVAQGGGSGASSFPYLVDPLTGLTEAFGKKVKIASSLDDYDLDKAAETAKDADVAFVFASTFASESYDRANLSLRNEADSLIKAVADANKNTVVIVHSVGPALLPWTNHSNIKAILWPGLPGQETGNSLADIITGAVNPSARLPYTIARQASDYNAKSDPAYNVSYSEKLLLGYKWFDQSDIEPLFPFGHGLSFTTFKYSKLKVKTSGSTSVTVTVSIQNSGKYDGSEVVQAYLSFPQSAGEPPKLLRGFEKVFLKKGKKETVKFELSKTELSIWDIVSSKWVVPSGKFTIHIGASSRDIRQSATFIL